MKTQQKKILQKNDKNDKNEKHELKNDESLTVNETENKSICHQAGLVACVLLLKRWLTPAATWVQLA